MCVCVYVAVRERETDRGGTYTQIHARKVRHVIVADKSAGYGLKLSGFESWLCNLLTGLR